MYISRHVLFDETTFPFANISSSSSPPLHTSSVLSSAPLYFYPQPSTYSFPIIHLSSAPISSSPNHTPINTQISTSTNSLSSSDLVPCLVPPDSQLPPPVHPSVVNTHPMQTRSKHGITKKKVFLATAPMTEPTSYTIAAKSPEWKKAMSEEFSALQQQGT